jgi:hypothetical protein
VLQENLAHVEMGKEDDMATMGGPRKRCHQAPGAKRKMLRHVEEARASMSWVE